MSGGRYQKQVTVHHKKCQKLIQNIREMTLLASPLYQLAESRIADAAVVEDRRSGEDDSLKWRLKEDALAGVRQHHSAEQTLEGPSQILC
mmetsp:Transcript_35171/g.91257  ORF Transcript_35171/g.91257 Transcript_35171/m.91257 type:complete len:90 (-) Transcript_35171:447-716(-)